MWAAYKNKQGFTIVELLIVIVIIGILAAITIVAYNGIQDRARTAKMSSDLTELSKAIHLARISKSTTLYGVTGNASTGIKCWSEPANTDLAALPKTDLCWTDYFDTLDKLSDASGMNISQLVDPWGRPYFINEKEGVPGEDDGCSVDVIAAFAEPFNGSDKYAATQSKIPLSGFSGCAI